MYRFIITLVTLVTPWLADAFAFPPLMASRSWRHELFSKSAWSVADDWSSLSNENPENAVPDSDDIYNEDLARQAASRMEFSPSGERALTKDEEGINEALDEVHNHGMFHSPDDPSLYDTGFEETSTVRSFVDEMGQQISMLVNCNERPEDMLILEGRALPPLSEEEKNDVKQLVTQTKNGEYEMTKFFRDAVSKMFHEHATVQEKDNGESHVFLDSVGVAAWMTKCLGPDKQGKITQHDRRVLATMSTYAPYGTGRLELDGFEQLYLSAVTAFLNGNVIKTGRDKKMELPTIDSVWRDIRNHGILAPVEEERERLANDIRDEFGSASNEETKAKAKQIDTLMDECEIVDWIENTSFVNDADGNNEEGSTRKKKSSYEMIELASDEKTPLRMKDGEFVFIDEESCIGCAMCATACPSSFVMLESGRARTFKQRRTSDVSTAINVCPVNCMHKVGFEELKEMETARDRGDGRSDHRHMGNRRGHTPLSVAGIDSDANHRSSWYHYLKHKCYTSSDCPKRGCYDCPNFREPGLNPYFIANQKKANRARVEDMMASGDADMYRKTAEL